MLGKAAERVSRSISSWEESETRRGEGGEWREGGTRGELERGG